MPAGASPRQAKHPWLSPCPGPVSILLSALATPCSRYPFPTPAFALHNCTLSLLLHHTSMWPKVHPQLSAPCCTAQPLRAGGRQLKPDEGQRVRAISCCCSWSGSQMGGQEAMYGPPATSWKALTYHGEVKHTHSSAQQCQGTLSTGVYEDKVSLHLLLLASSQCGLKWPHADCC